MTDRSWSTWSEPLDKDLSGQDGMKDETGCGRDSRRGRDYSANTRHQDGYDSQVHRGL